MLLRRGMLQSMVTDIWCPGVLSSSAAKVRSGVIRDLGGRYHPELAKANVRSLTLPRLWFDLRLRSQYGRTQLSSRDRVLLHNQWFTPRATRIVERIVSDQTAGVFSYSGTACELFEWARPRGLRCVLGQINPGFSEDELVKDELERWPGWELVEEVAITPKLAGRRRREWELADRLVVNSEWSRECLVAQGVPREKMSLVPLCYEAGEPLGVRKPRAPGPLRVLWLGQVQLRKGIQYLMAAARSLENEPVEFNVYGPINITTQALAQAPRNVHFFGRASRNKTETIYRAHDVFVLPTLSDGFAITQIEAMAHGLPVITTPNCGRVVVHGGNGLLVPAGDAHALASAVKQLARNPALVDQMAAAALGTVKQFSLNSVAQTLCKVLDEVEVSDCKAL
jgi:glycosyltransferase involved in cell wall biosynthesis